jgi:hypothetical protein
MLKLNYNDYGLFLEQVEVSLDAIAAQRVMLAICAGETLHLEPGRAAFLLPTNTPGVAQLERILQNEMSVLAKSLQGRIWLSVVDDGFVEVSLEGTWIARSAQAEFGVFITALTPESEMLVYQLWQTTQLEIAHVA